MKASRASRLFLVAAAVAGPSALGAQGFGLNEIGSCAIGRAFATTASPCRDASAIYWNPATTTTLTGWSVVAGVSAISLTGDFKQDTTGRSWDADVPTQWVPHVFVNYHPTNGKFAFGVGAYVPIRPHVAVDRQLPGPLLGEESHAAGHLHSAEHRLADQPGLVDWCRAHLRRIRRSS